jgi:hypothetical protein
MLQPFLQLAGIGILNRPREGPGRRSRCAVRERQFSVEDRRAHHLVERQSIGEFGRAAKRQHDIGENRERAAAIVTNRAAQPWRALRWTRPKRKRPPQSACALWE